MDIEVGVDWRGAAFQLMDDLGAGASAFQLDTGNASASSKYGVRHPVVGSAIRGNYETTLGGRTYTFTVKPYPTIVGQPALLPQES